MKNAKWLNLFLLAISVLPATAWADFSYLWSPPQGDKSIEFLGDIFGVVSNVLTGTGSPLIGNLFQIFNIAVLSLGSIVVSYTIILSAINTAQEGEVMGRKFSSVWIPLRCAVGMACLLPTASGYSLIQVLVMQITIFGIAAADQIWSVAVQSIGTKQALTGGVYMDTGQVNDTTDGVFYAMMCAQVFNNSPTCQSAVNNERVVFYTLNNQVNVGVPGKSEFASICGSFQPTNPPKNVTANTWYAANTNAITLASFLLLTPVIEAYLSSDPTQWHAQGVLSSAASGIESTLGSVPFNTPPPDNTNNANLGWLYAGSFYFEFISGGPDIMFVPPAYSEGETAAVGTTCSTTLLNYKTLASKYIASAGGSTETTTQPSDTISLQLNTSNVSSGSALYQAIAKPIQHLVYRLITYLTTNSGDPMSSLRNVGSNIMIVIENLWFFIMLLAFLLLLAACTMSALLPFCFAVEAIMVVVLPIFYIILALLWAAGALLGIYLPLVPYIVYTFTALGWFIVVIEAMAAAPVVALGLVSPASDTLGRAAPAVTIIASVFLRPSLMVIGFIISIQLVNAAITMVNFGFVATVKASTGGLGIFGCISLICLYGGLVIAIIHECFSLIHVLPDKVIRWIGGSAESTGAAIKGQVEEVKGAAQKGAQIGEGLMKGTAAKAEELGKEAGKATGKGLAKKALAAKTGGAAGGVMVGGEGEGGEPPEGEGEGGKGAKGGKGGKGMLAGPGAVAEKLGKGIRKIGKAISKAEKGSSSEEEESDTDVADEFFPSTGGSSSRGSGSTGKKKGKK